MNYAQIRIADGAWVVEQVIELDEKPLQPDSILLPIPAGADAPSAGQIYDSLNDEFVAGPHARRLTQFEFMTRLGFPALIAILAAARVDAEVDGAWQFATNAAFIDLDLPLTATLLGLLATKGLLTGDDVQTVLAGGSL